MKETKRERAAFHAKEFAFHVTKIEFHVNRIAFSHEKIHLAKNNTLCKNQENAYLISILLMSSSCRLVLNF